MSGASARSQMAFGTSGPHRRRLENRRLQVEGLEQRVENRRLQVEGLVTSRFGVGQSSSNSVSDVLEALGWTVAGKLGLWISYHRLQMTYNSWLQMTENTSGSHLPARTGRVG
jgi:hypothetical protein